MSNSELFFKGSSGCIFRPNIPCSKSKNKRSKNKITKLFISKNKEYEIGLKIKKIKYYKKWTLLWDKICSSPEYETLLKNTDIEQCLKSLNINPDYIHGNHKFTLYQGVYGGLTLNNYSKRLIKKKTFYSNKEFIRSFKKLFKLIENVFHGLGQLNKNNICHHDINYNNILVKNNKSYIIDYDISLEIDKSLLSNSFLNQRMNQEYAGNRIYEPYPFEYLYINLKESEIETEQKELALYQRRFNYYESYEPIHHQLFNIDTDYLRFELLEDKLLNENKQDIVGLIDKLDVYSLGMMLLLLYNDLSVNYEIPTQTLVRLFKLKELKPYMDLFNDMITFDYRDRIDIHEAYERYKNLI
jgi:serine/threonine protein kinase